ncbi:glutathione S-transferase family protein [Hoeflea olei]|uniref:Glutathione S-transferase n=1 Tax=Hoeflea olei TaxID=1480615 RepID=A0A1C1YYH0_9HYPH|nr:glutathione S-transferase family protein [Hoeflea olei]OCW58446.1 glutathione S-transferase [Hoeflea olei]
MLTLYHSPMSRSTRVVRLLDEMNLLDAVEIRQVSIQRADGSGGRDAANPHPEGKVPLLVHDGVEIRETGAILLYLTDLFPDRGLGVPVGDALRGRYLSWLFWYGDVLEPVLIHSYAKLEHPALSATFRGYDEAMAALAGPLRQGPWLLGERFTAADILCASPFAWMPSFMPEIPEIRDWFDRCQASPAVARTLDEDRKRTA